MADFAPGQDATPALGAPEETALRAQALRPRLIAEPGPVNDRLAKELVEHGRNAACERAILIAATEQFHGKEDDNFEREYEVQRTALWLALTGLGAVLLIGLAFDHRLSVLAGGLGGFLSPGSAYCADSVRPQRAQANEERHLAPQRKDEETRRRRHETMDRPRHRVQELAAEPAAC